MTEQEVLNDIETEFKEQFPDLDITKNQTEFNVFKQIIIDFTLPFQKEELFIYMNGREDSKCIAQHIADIPQGIRFFEEWFNKGLLQFATEILNTLQLTIPVDKVYLTFAHLLDSKDLETFFEKSQFNELEEKQLSGLLSLFIDNSELDLFLQALSCIYLGLNNSAKSLLKLWIQSIWFDGDDIQQVLDKAKTIKAIRKNASKAGISGASTRWAHRDETKNYAIELMLKGNYKNASRAASAIKEQVIVHGEKVGFIFAEDRAFTTISKLLRDYIKKNQTN